MRAVAVFDLDGTLSHADTLLPCLAAALRSHPARIPRLWTLPFAVLAYAFSRDRGALKGRLVHAVLGGLDRAALTRHVNAFLDRNWHRLFRLSALERLEQHRAAGDYLVLLSASPDLYVPEIGRRLGFDAVICTGLCWHGDRLDGHLATPNRRGAEKTRQLEQLRGAHPGARFSAYGNAASDLDHLVRVEEGWLVNGSPGTERRAMALGLHTAQWP